MFEHTPTTVLSVSQHRREVATSALRPLEVAFRAWVDGHAKPETLTVGTGNQDAMPLEHALRLLRASTELLAPARGHTLGLDDEASIAAASEVLLRACTDPDGPHCRSFRSASYYLTGLARINPGELFADEAPLGVASKHRAAERVRSPTAPLEMAL